LIGARLRTSKENGRSKTGCAVHVGAEKAPFAGGKRALAEAAVRRAERDRTAAQRPPESGRRGGELDPVRYGDWEVKGIATDF
jgi:hypothetical protein